MDFSKASENSNRAHRIPIEREQGTLVGDPAYAKAWSLESLGLVR